MDSHRLRKFPPWGEVSRANASQRACVMKGEMGPVYLAKGNHKCGNKSSFTAVTRADLWEFWGAAEKNEKTDHSFKRKFCREQQCKLILSLYKA